MQISTAFMIRNNGLDKLDLRALIFNKLAPYYDQHMFDTGHFRAETRLLFDSVLKVGEASNVLDLDEIQLTN